MTARFEPRASRTRHVCTALTDDVWPTKDSSANLGDQSNKQRSLDTAVVGPGGGGAWGGPAQARRGVMNWSRLLPYRAAT
jgi:hypothetical protein